MQKLQVRSKLAIFFFILFSCLFTFFQENFLIPMLTLLWPDVPSVRKKLMSIHVLIVTRNVVMIAVKHIVISSNVKSPESIIKSREVGIVLKIALDKYVFQITKTFRENIGKLILFFKVDRNNTQLQQNATTVLNEIEEMHNRLASVLRERTEFLKSSVDKYLNVESKTLKDLKDNLELELANIKVSITDSLLL